MQILSVRILQGPNIYSFRPLVKVTLDIGQYEEVPSNRLKDFNESLLAVLPGLKQHCCSKGYPGGFQERLVEGTYMAHIFEHIVLELQLLAGYDVKFGKTRKNDGYGIYDIVIGFRIAEAAVQAVYETEELLEALLSGQKKCNVAEAVQRIRELGGKHTLGPSTQALYDAAKSRSIPVSRVGNESLLILGYGCKQERVWATITSRTSTLATDLACDKYLTNRFLTEYNIPVPFGQVAESSDQAIRIWRRIGKNVVTKPLCGNQGKGVTISINSQPELARAFDLAREYGEKVLVEEYIPGRQYRLCVVNGKLSAASERRPACVTGDGEHTVAELVESVNKEPLRGQGHTKQLTRITLDAVALTVLAKQDLSPHSIPEPGRTVCIRENANLSTGGTALDVTDMVHPLNRKLAERVAQIIGLDVAGIDIVVPDISLPIVKGYGAVIEVNAAPGIRMHHYPSAGKPRNVADDIVSYLFPEKENGRIPIIAVTGTNGKTTTVRMIQHIWSTAGYKTGMTTTDGIYINGQCIEEGDTTGPVSTRKVLLDPDVESAVLEVARGGLLRGGLAFDACDIGVITNITEDHLGQDGIETLEDLAFVKSLIVESVQPDGYSLLNADDPYVVSLARYAKGEVAYFSLQADNIVVRRHLGAGGKAFFVKNSIMYVAFGGQAKRIMSVKDIPATFKGLAQHNIQNALIAAAACYCSKIPLAYIKKGLSSFAQNPGRLTLLQVNGFRVCVDYGHNPAGYQALIRTVQKMGAKRLVGVIAAPGDRRNDVIINIGRIAGYGFHSIYIKEDSDLRGRQNGEVAGLLQQGVLEAGLSADRIKIVLPEFDAVKTALEEAHPGDMVVVFYEKYNKVLAAVQDFCQSEKNKPEKEDGLALINNG